MFVALTIYSILLLVVYQFAMDRTFKYINPKFVSIETLFIYFLLGGWLIIYMYNVYKIKKSKSTPLLASDLLSPLYSLIKFVLILGVLIFVADIIPSGKTELASMWDKK